MFHLIGKLSVNLWELKLGKHTDNDNDNDQNEVSIHNHDLCLLPDTIPQIFF